jgi:hypothetical protein
MATFDLTQATAGKRPLLDITSGLSALAFDGVDDGLVSASGRTWAAASDYVFALKNSTGDTSWIMVFDAANTGSGWIGVVTSGDASGTNGGGSGSGSPTPTDLVNGAAVSPDTRGGMYTAIGTSAAKVWEGQGTGFAPNTCSLWATAIRTFQLGGLFYGIVIVQHSLNSASERWPAFETWLGRKGSD